MLARWLNDIPTEPSQIDEAVEKVQMLVLKTYSFIRSQVCDQVELLTETFFKLPMLRRLIDDMANIELSEEDKANYQARRESVEENLSKKKNALSEIESCIEKIQTFKVKCEARGITIGL